MEVMEEVMEDGGEVDLDAGEAACLLPQAASHPRLRSAHPLL